MTDDVLSAPAMALYERLVSAAALPLSPGGVDPAAPEVRELLDAGFAEVMPHEPRYLVPVEPVEAFEGVLARLQTEFFSRQRQLVDAYRYLDGLQQSFLDSQPMADAEWLADVRTGEDAYLELAGELTAGAREELSGWNLPLQQLIASPDVRARAVYDTAFLQREGGSAVLRRARAAGEDLRIADDLPSSMLIADTSAVVLPLSGGTTGALLIRSDLVVNAMREFFEMVWQRSVPWTDREAAGEILTPVQRHVVALIALGHGDDEIAAHLRVSLRTVRRHVSDVMERLGAGTRFAAGIAAAQAGLLENTDLGRVTDDGVP